MNSVIHTFKEKTTLLYKLVRRDSKENFITHEISITSVPKPKTLQEENKFRPIFLMNIEVKSLLHLSK